jgi:TAK1-binding protein 1
MNTLQVYQEHQVELDRLHDIQIELAGGTTAVVGLVYQGNLYVANVGDSRALLCTSDEAGNLYVQVLSVDHTPKNPNEIARLASLGLDVELLTRGKRMAGLEHTRSIGDYALKGGYKDFDIIRYDGVIVSVIALKVICKN